MKIVFGFDQYKCPTPKRMRQVGDSFLVMMLALKPMIISLPMPDSKKIYWGVALDVVCVVAKFFTNCFGYEEKDEKSTDNYYDGSSNPATKPL